MKEAKVTNISFYNYGTPSLSVQVQDGDGHISTFSIKDADLSQVLALVWQMIEKKKFEFAEQIMKLQTPVALQDLREFPETKTLDDEIPF